jgi:predicted O-methyltransferase YrrM
MSVVRFISSVQRRQLGLNASVAPLFDLFEPLFMIDTHMSFEERVGLMAVAFSLRKGFVACEIGSYLGASTAFLAAVASVGGGHLHAVDTWQNDAMGIEPAEDTFQRFLENTRQFEHLITKHRGRAEHLAGEVPPVDLLFIDGDHSYEGVTQNLKDYAGKIKPGGVLLLHDFNVEAVRRAVDDFFRQGELTPGQLVDSLKVFRVHRHNP